MLFDGQYAHEEPIGKDRVEAIKPGQTTIKEVMTRLGPPIAVARRGQTIICPHNGANACAHETPAEVFFELFLSDRKLKEDKVVYYYQASRVTDSGLVIILLAINGGGIVDRTRAEQLWLLVNEKTGLIDDLVYRPG